MHKPSHETKYLFEWFLSKDREVISEGIDTPNWIVLCF